MNKLDTYIMTLNNYIIKSEILERYKEFDYEDEDDMELENAMVAEIEKKNKNYDANNVSMNAKSKAGYCYVGADRNVRTCVKVGEDDVCMSGDIYPTMDLCVNPNLKD